MRLDLRYAARRLRKHPLFAFLAVLTLALGIGANTTIFSVLYATILRRLPFAEPDRLVRLNMVTPPDERGTGNDRMVWSFPKFETFRDAQKSFALIAAYSWNPMTLTTGEGAERLQGETVTGDYFRVLGISPMAGRDFGPDEDKAPGATRVALLGEALWERQFSADPAIIGTTVRLDALPTVIIGIVPRRFPRSQWTGRSLGRTLRRAARRTSANAGHTGSTRWPVSSQVCRWSRPRPETTVLGSVVDAAHVPPADFGPHKPWGAIARPLEASRIDPADRPQHHGTRRGRGPRAPPRLREPRRTAAGTRHSTAPRNRGPAGTRRAAQPGRQAALRRKHGAGAPRWRGRHRRRNSRSRRAPLLLEFRGRLPRHRARPHLARDERHQARSRGARVRDRRSPR